MVDAMTDPRNNSSDLPSKPPIWNDPKYRALFFQIILIAILGYLFYSVFSNTRENMSARGIPTGFDFLSEKAGFDIAMSLIPYDSDSTYGRTFVVGLLNTLLAGVIGIILATILGFIMGIARLSNNWVVAKIATVYIEVFRNIPLLIQLFFWYIAVLGILPSARESYSLSDAAFLNVKGLYLPKPVVEDGFMFTGIIFALGLIATFFVYWWAKNKQMKTGETTPTFLIALALLIVAPLLTFFATGSPMTWDLPKLGGFNFAGGIEIIPELFALLLGLTIYTGAFIAEIVRSGMQAVDHGQTEAALSVGLTPAQNLKLVVIPQALRVIIPPLTNQYLNLVKNSSLAMAIAYPDIVAVFMGTTLNQTGQAVQITVMTMGVYLAISLAISFFMNWYNAKMSLVER